MVLQILFKNMQLLKKLFRSILGLVYRANPFFRYSLKNKLVIFVFHEVSNSQSEFTFSNSIAHSVFQFERHVKWIKKNFNVISPKDLFTEKKLPKYAALITFDDGYEGTFKNGLKILKKYKLPSIIFLNCKPIIESKPNLAATAIYLGRKNNFLKYAKKNFLKKPFHLSLTPQHLKVFRQEYNDHLEEEIHIFQGKLASMNTLKKWEEEENIFYGNHLYDHWNAKALTKNEFINEYNKNKQVLFSFKNYLNLFAFTNGKPGTCFSKEHIKILKELKPEKIFSASNGINSGSSSFLLGRLSTHERDISENHLWFRLGSSNSIFFK